MRAYFTNMGIVIEKDEKFYYTGLQDWESFINNDSVFNDTSEIIKDIEPRSSLQARILAPIGANQEVWACGVTYLRSRIGREEESKVAGGSDFYARVYEAERPEVFMKATPRRVVGHMEQVAIRKDSQWDVPEPELTLVTSPSGKIVGYTVGNDMSSRSIEGENPLYLPQAKTYDACAAVGPCVYLTDKPLTDAMITLTILRDGKVVFDETININQMKRKPEELVAYVYRECSFPHGCLIMTGTGIVPSSDFTLQQNDEIRIDISHIGTLVNTVR